MLRRNSRVSTPQVAINSALMQVDKALVDAFIERGVNEALAVALVQGDVLIDHGIDALAVPSQAKPLIARELEWLAKQTSPTLPRKEAEAAGGWKQSKGLTLQTLGVLGTFNLDTRVQVSTRDITRYRTAQILLSYPIDGGSKLKIRQPRARFQKAVRARRPQELEGLRKGNERRAREAQLRREGKTKTERRARRIPQHRR